MYKLLCLLVAYIIVSSVCIGYFVYESENEQIQTLQTIDYTGDLITLDGSIPLNMFVNSGMSTSNLQYVTIENYGELLQISPSYTAIGRFNPIDNTLYIRGIESDNNVYSVTYNLYNPDNTDFSIISAVTNPNWFTGNKKLLISKFENVGTNSMQLIVRNVEDSTLDYALNTPIYTNINIVNYWNSNGINKLSTIYDKNNKVLSIYLNDNLIGANIPADFGNDELIMYAGIRIEEDNKIYLKSIESKVYLTEDTENSQNLLLIIAQLLVWNVDEQYLPSIINFILVKIPIIFLSIGLALYLRGVS